MNYKISLYFGLVPLVVAAMLTGSASAVDVTVLNPSFEEPTRPDGLDGSTPAWPSSAGGGGVWNPVAPYFPGTDGDGTAVGADGVQVYYFSGGPKYAHQILADTLQVGTYTLTIAVGRMAPETLSLDTDTFIISLSTDVLGGSFVKDGEIVTTDGTPLAALTDDATSLTEGAFVDRRLSLVVESDNEHIGEALQIDIGSAGGWGIFDKVRLDFSAYALPGDASRDGLVNGDDAALLAANWLSDVDVSWDEGDFNNDGIVNDLDATILAANWSQAGTAAQVPEPSALMLLACGLVCLLIAGFRKAV